MWEEGGGPRGTTPSSLWEGGERGGKHTQHQSTHTHTWATGTPAHGDNRVRRGGARELECRRVGVQVQDGRQGEGVGEAHNGAPRLQLAVRGQDAGVVVRRQEAQRLTGTQGRIQLSANSRAGHDGQPAAGDQVRALARIETATGRARQLHAVIHARVPHGLPLVARLAEEEEATGRAVQAGGGHAPGAHPCFPLVLARKL